MKVIAGDTVRGPFSLSLSNNLKQIKPKKLNLSNCIDITNADVQLCLGSNVLLQKKVGLLT